MSSSEKKSWANELDNEKRANFSKKMSVPGISQFFFVVSEFHIQATKTKIKIKTHYPQGKGPTQELYSSSRRTAVVPLFKNYMQFFVVIFLGWVMLLHPQTTSTDHGGPRTSDLSIERGSRKHFTTAYFNQSEYQCSQCLQFFIQLG